MQGEAKRGAGSVQVEKALAERASPGDTDFRQSTQNSDAMAGRMPAMQQTTAKSLIPRAKLFGNPTRAQAQLSPDGAWLSWLAPKDGVLNIWVAPVGDMDAARVISNDSKRGIRFHGWMHNGTHVLYIQDESGTEDFHVFAVEVATSQSRNLTPLQGVQAQMLGLSRDFPDIVAVGLNERDKSWHDAFRLDIRTGKRELLFENRA